MIRFVATFAVTLLVVLALDGLWLGVIAKSLYRDGMGDLMSPHPRLGFAAMFYTLYPVALIIFAISPHLHDLGRASLFGALFGLFAYATYDLTNLSVVRDWPVALSFIDIAWGTVLSGIASASGAATLRWLGSRS